MTTCASTWRNRTTWTGRRGSASSSKPTKIVSSGTYVSKDGVRWKCSRSSGVFSSCRDRNDLAEVVALLKTQIDPELLKKEQENKPAGEDKKAEGKRFCWERRTL